MRWTYRPRSGNWKYKPHEWFAWYPVRLGGLNEQDVDGSSRWAWLQRVTRRKIADAYDTWWEYEA